jgi:hypothetical protein
MDGVNHEPEDDADAVRAFEALRAEVAALRRAVEERDAPDDSRTPGAMGKVLTAIGSRLDRMEAHPALRLTPEQHAQDGEGQDVSERVYLPHGYLCARNRRAISGRPRAAQMRHVPVIATRDRDLPTPTEFGR